MTRLRARSLSRAAGTAVALALVAALAIATSRDRAGSAVAVAVDVHVAAAQIAPVDAAAKAQRVLPRLYSADLALGIVAGYAFADGQIAGGTYTYDMGGDGLADQFRGAILDAGGTVVPHGSHGASSSGLRDLGLSTHGALTRPCSTGPPTSDEASSPPSSSARALRRDWCGTDPADRPPRAW